MKAIWFSTKRNLRCTIYYFLAQFILHMKTYDLKRFLDAQETMYATALSEIKTGRKRSHWMWFIFPQIKGLGFSRMSGYYGIENMEEATLYMAHPVLGARMIELCQALLALPGSDPHAVFGSPDDLKLQSSLTLFASTKAADPLFNAVLQKLYASKKDPQTLKILGLAE